VIKPKLSVKLIPERSSATAVTDANIFLSIVDEELQDIYTFDFKIFYQQQDRDLTSYSNSAQLSSHANFPFLCM